MNFESEISRINSQIKNLLAEAENALNSYNSAAVTTKKLLAKCEAAGITKVAIGRKHKSVPASTNFPFGGFGSVFTFSPVKNKGSKIDGWPAIWGICDELNINDGCGNTDQRQIKPDTVVDGVYHLKKGYWIKVE